MDTLSVILIIISEVTNDNVDNPDFPTNIINVKVCEDGCMGVCYSFTQKLLNGFG